MSRLTDLIAQAKAKDPQMGADLEREFRALSSRRSFGLNFERHRPENVELPQRPVRKGDKVRVLPPRGDTSKGDQRLWVVKHFEIQNGKKVAHLVERYAAEPETRQVDVTDLVVVAEFRDKIYPGLVSTGKVEKGGDKPFHSVINGENYHVLKGLTFTHRGKVDVIYIDPPYNTGARDWKYNNDYVESEDLYRHSKWLAFIERRLKIAKELLNPKDSVLVVTIDEKEYLRLGLLLEQLFPEGDIQMVTSVINRAGSQRVGSFSRVEEYIFYVFIGGSKVNPWTSTMLEDELVKESNSSKMPTVWFTAVRRGTSSALRDARPNLFYPVYIDAHSGRFVSVGDPIEKNVDRQTVTHPEGVTVMWPVHTDGTEQTWRFSAERMREKLADGTARFGKRNAKTGMRPITYLQPGTLKNIDEGIFIITGRTEEGALELAMAEGAAKSVAPRTVWNKTSHFARDHGSTLLKTILGEKRFDFPKSLFAVEDTLRFVVSDKPDAVILDFFAGSGTTAHAVMRLNRQDGGSRQCISVTNNEVAASEQKELLKKGKRPGDLEWEQLGICDFVTKPRVKAVITGTRPDGAPLTGDYKFNDVYPMSDGLEENAEFFTLTYETPISINHNLAFSKIAPLLWLRAGSRGGRIEELPLQGWDIAETYGVLADLDKSQEFCARATESKDMKIAYIVTNDDRRFQSVARNLPKNVEPVRLYEAYLNNFQFTNGE
ncbi:site-specific DNA-methyltransferase [Vibrio parahaemolyticus]|uniref:site-specific DNA-methyltransferase n=1 Tax=Vibrio parahaemolyticus TaxID=670 RepID=UPI00146F2093|nr:DNA methyltransferase [Vibrio parahaemolyticus]MDF5161960.1 DNA methyltransferase [Vibrio parahaemolyticus]NMS67461.1 site-specific DNA-methyltransferase [Vibrio parahaemolyticus]NMV26129.1 site-specific DNA-methyltransferase [Vibrio parahaemolyticus]